MDTNKNIYKFLNLLYKNKGKKFTSKDIAKELKIRINDVTAYHNRVSEYVYKTKLNNKNYFWLKPFYYNYTKKIIERSLQQHETRLADDGESVDESRGN